MFSLACTGLVAIALLVFRKVNPQPPVGREIVSVSIDDPGMEYTPEFTGQKAWMDPAYLIASGGMPFDLPNAITTTYMKKD